MADAKIEVENVNVPGHVTRVDGAKYSDMKKAMLRIVTSDTPGMTAKEIKDAAVPHLSSTLFPEGKTAGWWAKTVQLDLEAKGVFRRSDTKPLRWYKP
ncbi:MAG: hypothetical protein OXC60_08930 [Litoreibacter sp.]|nr:hypothetical protein [Litoreibacter sp.]